MATTEDGLIKMHIPPQINRFLVIVRELVVRGFWAPAVVLAIHFALSAGISDFYAAYPFLDIPVHLGGGMAFAFAAWRGLEVVAKHGHIQPAPLWLKVLLIVALTATAAEIWEFVEFLSDTFLGTQAQLNLYDTLLDQFLGLAGGVLFVVWVGLRELVFSKGREKPGPTI